MLCRLMDVGVTQSVQDPQLFIMSKCHHDSVSTLGRLGSNDAPSAANVRIWCEFPGPLSTPLCWAPASAK